MKVPPKCYVWEDGWVLVQTRDRFSSHMDFDEALANDLVAFAVGDPSIPWLIQCANCTEWGFSCQHDCGFCGQRLIDLLDVE